MNLPMNWLPVIPLCGGFLVLFWFRFGGFGLFCFLLLLALVVDDDGLLDYVQVLHQFRS